MSEFSTYQKRKPLYKQLPLNTPLSVHICPSTFCNFKCQYCVHSVSGVDSLSNGLKKQFMDINIFDKIIAQLKKFPQKLKLLNFAYLGEPLLHKNIADMIKRAKDADITERVEIVSNASVLSEELSEKLVDAGLDRLRVSIQGLNDDEYSEMSKVNNGYFNKIVENLDYMYKYNKQSGGGTSIYIKTVDAVVETDDRKKRFMELFGDKCDNINIEGLIPLSSECNIDNLKNDFDTGFFGNKVKKTQICSEVFYTMVITPSGDMFPCCTMGYPPFVMGNVDEISISDAWNSEEFCEFRILMIKNGYEAFESCKGCGVPMYQTAETDYLDGYRDELLKKYGG